MHTATVNRAPDEGHEPLRPRLLRPQLRHLNSNEKEGTTVKSTWHAAKSASTKLGLFATLRACLRAHGSGARKISRRLAAPTGVLGCFLASVAGAALLPQAASAYATIEGPPLFSSAPGLPDGRVYEQVSPVDKNGNQAGASTQIQEALPGFRRYSLAAANGNSVLFEGTGALGETDTAESQYYVATKNKEAVGWSTRAVMPRPLQSGAVVEAASAEPQVFDPSADLTHALVASSFDTLAPVPAAANGKDCGDLMYLTGSDPFVAGTWLERPSPGLADPAVICNEGEGEGGAPVGGTSDFSTAYFTYPGTFLSEDASRTPHAKRKDPEFEGVEAWGFYEDREGVLHNAGMLPDGSFDPFGAVPADSGRGRALYGNEVSTQDSPDGAPAGSRAFFVSPDPASCAQVLGTNNCAVDPPELYVRESGEKSVLVSRDTLLPDVGGLPAAAPDGPLQMLNSTEHFAGVGQDPGSYVFASPDGSQAFFQSTEDLTEAAKDASAGSEAKTYDFDVETGVLTYLPGVVGQILDTDADGDSLAFLRPETEHNPQELDQWSAGPAGGSVTSVTSLPDAGVTEARMSSDGSILVFITASSLSNTFNSGGFEQIYRYDSVTNTLGCVSCAPAGVTPAGGALISQQLLGSFEKGVIDKRGISTNGGRVFFQTQTPLVPQDTNTNSPEVEVREDEYEKQGMDVYEWENGVVYLISSGKSLRDSYLLDSSENGDDVFFATMEGLVPSDTDGAYDVYDARVPQPGDNPPPAAVPCEGSVCQGPPRVPSPLAASASSTFNGLGNPVPEPTAVPVAKPKPTAKAKRCKKGYVKKKGKCVKKPKAKTHKGSK
jgi:hypothetical protein